MAIIWGIDIPEEIEDNKLNYKLFLYSSSIDNSKPETKTQADKLYEFYKKRVAEEGKDLIKKYNNDLKMYIFYISIPNYYITVPTERLGLEYTNKKKVIFELYDIIDLESEVDKKRGKKLITGMSEKFYNNQIYYDMVRRKIYLYIESDRDAEE